jgi:hypothetical protein
MPLAYSPLPAVTVQCLGLPTRQQGLSQDKPILLPFLEEEDRLLKGKSNRILKGQRPYFWVFIVALTSFLFLGI